MTVHACTHTHICMHVHTHTCIHKRADLSLHCILMMESSEWGRGGTEKRKGLCEQSAGKQTRRGQHWMKEGLGRKWRGARGGGLPRFMALTSASFSTGCSQPRLSPPLHTSLPIYLLLLFASSEPLPPPSLRPRLRPLVGCESSDYKAFAIQLMHTQCELFQPHYDLCFMDSRWPDTTKHQYCAGIAVLATNAKLWSNRGAHAKGWEAEGSLS